MKLTTRQTGIISYAGLDESALWEGARNVFAHADEPVPERFRAFLPLFPAELIVNMSYVGKSRMASPSGFSLDANEYHRKLSGEMPDLYAGDNRLRLFASSGSFRGGVVTVDEVWAKMFPQYEPFMGEKLMIHMIGGGHQAVAVPESIFPRSGGVLDGAERGLGITERCGHYAAWLRERLRLGDVYDPVRFEEEYLAQTELNSVCIRQKDLSRRMQDLSIVRDLQGGPPAQTALYTEYSRSAEHISQYVPYRYACDTFEEEPVTRQTARLVQLYYEGDNFQSNLWLPYSDAMQYLNRKRVALDMRALCEGFQIAPATDADTRGGCYPNRIRVANVRDRSLKPMVASALNNPAYGSGLSPSGMINRIVWLRDSAELIRQGKLSLESHSITCENTRIDEEDLLRMRALAEWQEHKGRLIDAMYRRESALSQMQPGTLSYERAKDLLDAKVDRLAALIQDAPTAYGQRSGYDADIEYLRRLALRREGDEESVIFAADPQREKSIETGYAMRAKAQSYALSDLYQKPAKEAAAKEPENRRQRAANGQWFEQMDFLTNIPDSQQS